MLLNRSDSGERWRIRPDGPGKVTGRLVYLTDMSAQGMLIGRVLRSPHPYAVIKDIRTEKASKLPGVHAVLTHKDIPGLNGFGIAVQDQPVFCRDAVRYVGDAVAAVAAESAEAAERALSLIQVDYEPLQAVTDPELAVKDDAPKLHSYGNVLHKNEHRSGSIESAFARSVHIVEETYITPRQMHTYMETEGGLFVPEKDGRLSVYAPTQHGLLDRLQLSRILAVPESLIRVVSSPIGGSFGGKDELNVQPYGALLAMHTGRPVKIHNSRWESVRAGLKRHPMRIRMKTGVDAEGRLTGHQVSVIADTGPYATLGAEVLNFATEHVIGPYRYAGVDVISFSVHTNNGMSGEFRGFGGNQAIFALEGQMDRLAGRIAMDPWDFRRLNLRRPGDPGPFGQPIARTDGAREVWQALADCPLRRELLAAGTPASASCSDECAAAAPGGDERALQFASQAAAAATGKDERAPQPAFQAAAAEDERALQCASLDAASAPGEDELAPQSASKTAAAAPEDMPWLRTGIGCALVMHGAGLGYGIPDPGGGRLTLTEDGRIEAAFGYEECGQGLLATLELMMIEQFGFAAEDLVLTIGDTDRVPDSGSTTASRATTMMWKALRSVREPFTTKLLTAAKEASGNPLERLRTGPGGIYDTETGELLMSYKQLADSAKDRVTEEAALHYPSTSMPRTGAHFLYTYAAVAVKVEVNTLTGRVRVLDQFHTVAAGPVMNPQGYLGQIEGGSSMALGFALTEEVVMERGEYVTRNLDTYLIPTIAEHRGGFSVLPLEALPEGDAFGPRGVGEIGSVGLAPAIAAAVHNAVGKRVAKLPIDPAELQERPFCTDKAVTGS
jgi:CO/xanthine dehydrogenase Mo-binding subunit